MFEEKARNCGSFDKPQGFLGWKMKKLGAIEVELKRPCPMKILSDQDPNHSGNRLKPPKRLY
jgi:hypothetical protein